MKNAQGTMDGGTTRRQVLKAGTGMAAAGVLSACGGGNDPVIVAPAVPTAVSAQVATRVYGNDAYPVWHRRPIPPEAPRARYYGYAPGTVLLKQGTVRLEGALPLPCDMYLDRDVPVTLRDGIVIYTDVYRPAAAGKYPSILSWSPYGKEIGSERLEDVGGAGVDLSKLTGLQKFEAVDPGYWVNQGYVVVNPDTRGAYRSGGNLCFWGRQHAEDGYDCIEWMAARDWSNGKVGMAGNSWLAISQWFIAAEQPPHLAAIAPWEGLADVMRDSLVRGGIPLLTFQELITQSLPGTNLLEDLPKMAMSEPNDNAYWKDKAARMERVTVPAYVVASYDNAVHTHGTFDAFRRIASAEKWLRVHNSSEWPDFYQSQNQLELLSFFDHYLKGTANGWTATPRIRMSVIDPGGTDVVGRVVDAWPPAGYTATPLYLQADRSMSTKPATTAATVSYAVANAPPAVFRMPVTAESELVGYLKLKLWVEAVGSDDMDLVVLVEKVTAAGSQPFHLPATAFQATGFQRASRRALDASKSTASEPYLSFAAEQRLSAGQVVPLEIGIWPTALRLHAGEYLQVTVAPYATTPQVLPLGAARISVPVDSYTYTPGTTVAKLTLGGDASTSPAYAAQQAVAEVVRNAGTHVLHVGGIYDSHLLAPLRSLAA